MKVKELEKGMLLTPVKDNEWFALYGNPGDKFLHIRGKPAWLPQPSASWNTDIRETRTAIYLGTKKDLQVNQRWVNQFVFFDGEILGIDPSSWRRIQPIK